MSRKASKGSRGKLLPKTKERPALNFALVTLVFAKSFALAGSLQASRKACYPVLNQENLPKRSNGRGGLHWV